MAPKRKRVVLQLNDKLKIIENLEKGVSVAQISAEYGIGMQTVRDIRKQKGQIRMYVGDTDDPRFKRKTMKTGLNTQLEDAVLKWLRQQQSAGVNVRGTETKNAAVRLAAQMEVPNFSASNGWLFRFRRRHAVYQQRVFGEAASAVVDEVGPFRTKLNNLIREEGLMLSQIYNFDETGLFWRALPSSTNVVKSMGQVKGRKLDKTLFSVLCDANADGTHRCTPIVVDKSARPRCLKDCMRQLPCHYYASVHAWFTADIFTDCYFKHIVPSIIEHQTQVLKIHEERYELLSF